MSQQRLSMLLDSVQGCQLCENLELGPKPIFQLHPEARILVAGQAPGRTTHHKGRPFDDPSGRRLREWMDITENTFYDATRIAILPMAFCFPGSAERGDLPPPPVCAKQWRRDLLNELPNLELTLLIGCHAINWHLGKRQHKTLRDTVIHWQDYAPELLPLPHPSPRNNGWLKNNPWFGEELLPPLRARVSQLL